MTTSMDIIQYEQAIAERERRKGAKYLVFTDCADYPPVNRICVGYPDEKAQREAAQRAQAQGLRPSTRILRRN